MAECDIMRNRGHTVEGSIGRGTQIQQTVKYEIMTDIGKTVEERNGQRETEKAEGKL
jgi:hypothetical protein